MRQGFGVLLCLGVCLLLAGSANAATESAKEVATPAAKESVKPDEKTPAKPTTEAADKKPEAGAAPVAAGDVCAIQATEQQAQIQALQAQIDALKNQITMQQGGVASQPAGVGALPAGLPDLAIRSKNLPKGNYRERCFSCLTMPDEDAERVLMCTCPVGQHGLERLSVNLTNCKQGEDISYCNGMLVCGTCLIKQNLGSNPLSTPSSDLDKTLKKSLGKQ